MLLTSVTTEAPGISVDTVDGSQHPSLDVRGRDVMPGAACCSSVFHYSQSSVDDGEGKDSTSGPTVGFERSCCTRSVSTQGSNYTEVENRARKYPGELVAQK